MIVFEMASLEFWALFGFWVWGFPTLEISGFGC